MDITIIINKKDTGHEEDFVYNTLGIFPHCDSKVLHKPGQCKYCDEKKEWQALRIHWGINFTGENDKNKSKCPSELMRPVGIINKWPGNRPNGE